MRGRHDAVMVGVGTVLADDPELTCRLPGFRSTPIVRVIADSHLRTPLTATVAVTARTVPTWMVVRAGTDRERRRAFADLGVTLIEVPGAETGIDPAKALGALAAAGLTQVLVEGGAQLAASLLRANLVDRIAWFHAPAVMGGDAWPAVQAFGVASLDGMPRFARVGDTPLGDDMLTEFVRRTGQ
jgi:diaminohydroxyphosphoribosylaminopyrimidine deaminase/5-amino-6-(5-phosphoribosylamino)uracil reductase